MNSSAEVRIHKDGSVEVLSAVQDIGSGIKTVARKDGRAAQIPVRLRTRGHSRRKPTNCTFAPLAR